MFDFLAKSLAFFYGLWPSYGGAIGLLTLAIMLLLTPLSVKSTRSMIRMQRLQPEIKRLQTQYKGDREALNREMMAFYQANNVNPLTSCLPMLLQLPVFFVLYRILHGLTQAGTNGGFAPKYLDHQSSLYKSLANQANHGKMDSFGIDLARSMLKALNSGFGQGLPYVLMVGVVVLTTWYQQRQIAGRTPAASMNQQQQLMQRIVPFVMVPITVSIPAGVVIYFIISNLVRVGQQALITRLEYGSGGGPTVIRPTPTTPPPKPSPGTDKPSTKPASKPAGRATPPAAARNRSNKKRKRK